MRYDLAFLAFQTDSTRVAVALEGEAGPGDAPGTQIGLHDASHHGQSPEKIEQSARYEEEETRHVADLLDKLHATAHGDVTLLDRTLVICCSNIGNPSAHVANNLPVFIADGGLKHRGHLAFDRKDNHRFPISTCECCASSASKTRASAAARACWGNSAEIKSSMKRHLSILLLSLAAVARGADFYVSPTGSNSNAGTEAARFQTIARARDAAKAVSAGMTGNKVINMRGGTYV